MALSNKHRTIKAKKSKRPIDKPPQQFPTAIKPHVFDPSGVFIRGLTPAAMTCLICGQSKNYKLHIKSHTFEVNLSSKLGRCMCGLNEKHEVHIG